jgi:NAD-dependent deacetylase
MDIEKSIMEAAEILSGCTNALASCGAGISEESGIPTFRDPGGVWDTMDPAEVGTTEGLIQTLNRDAARVIPFFVKLLDTFELAMPNPAHKALADLEAMGILKTVVTQNIDNLHQEAGSTEVIEVHGNGFRLACLSCGRIASGDRRDLIAEARGKISALSEYSLKTIASVLPACGSCGSMMRPDVVMFGEMVKDIPKAFSAAQKADAFLAIGTSGVVYPAAYLPFEAKAASAKVIVVNPNENAFANISDVYIPMKAGEAMPRIVGALQSLAL